MDHNDCVIAKKNVPAFKTPVEYRLKNKKDMQITVKVPQNTFEILVKESKKAGMPASTLSSWVLIDYADKIRLNAEII